MSGRGSFRLDYDFTIRGLMRPGSYPAFSGRVPPIEFDPSADAGNVNNALWLAGLSHLTYHDQESRVGELERLGLRCVRSIQVGTTCAFVAATEHWAVLAFQGTTRGFDEIRIDLDARRVSLGAEDRDDEGADRKEVRVHAGFLSASRAIAGQVDEGLAEIADLPLWCTGHSLGGALAVLHAVRRAPKAMVTFGAPRVGGSDFTALLQDVSFARYVNACDLVPTLPPEALGYEHQGEHRFLTARARLFVSPRPGLVRRARGRARWPYFVRSLRHLDWVKSRTLADHSIQNYTAALSRAKTRF